MSRPALGLKGGRTAVLVIAAVGFLLLIGRLASTAFIEVVWHTEAGYGSAFWTRVLWQWGARVLGGVGVGVLIFLNLRVVATTLGGIQIKRRFGNLEISEQLPASYVMWAMLAVSGLLALWFGAAVPRAVGMQALMLAHAAPWGVVDPVLGHDVGFYAFWLPLLGSVVTFLLVVTFLVFTLVTAGYAATGALRWGRGRVTAQDVTRLHLGILIGAFLGLLAARIWLGRYFLLLGGTSEVQGIVGFTDVQARLPALQTLTVLCVAAGGVAGWGAWKNRTRTVVAALGAVIAASLLIGQLYPALVQRFQVQPNELERETPYIDHNLEFTRFGFGLDGMERRPFPYSATAEPDWAEAVEQFAGLPVWNEDALLTLYDELEARFIYYDFQDVAIDRYPGPDGPVPLAVSVREVDPAGIQDPNWQNLYLRERYVRGMGAVASEATKRTASGRPPMVLSGIPPVAAEGTLAASVALERPQVFFGGRGRRQAYAIINPSPTEFLAPDGSPGQAGVDFPEGIRLGSPFHTLALAWRFGDANLFLATDVSERSRFVFRRRVLDRVEAVAPFLTFPEPAYPVVSQGRIVWIIEGFTGTRAFPLATRHRFLPGPELSFVRNSVKVTVDAVTGRMDFYRVPVDDPLADAFSRAFPGLFRPIEEMPSDLRGHVRYPKQLLRLQAEVLLQYHQSTAAAFHGQQDVWNHSRELASQGSAVAYQPEYGIYRLPGEDEASFTLTTVFVPAERQNLTAILAARTDGSGRPELVLYDVSVDDQVQGPRQIEALVEQDPRISQQFSLWRTGGSEVWTGHLHLVPSGNRLLYMEPVFLAAEADAIPELRRYVVSDGTRVVMTEDLTSAVAALAGVAAPDPDGMSGEAGAGGRSGSTAWPASALRALDRAEERMRAGDWAGFGQALEELRLLLRGVSGADTVPPVDPPGGPR